MLHVNVQALKELAINAGYNFRTSAEHFLSEDFPSIRAFLFESHSIHDMDAFMVDPAHFITPEHDLAMCVEEIHSDAVAAPSEEKPRVEPVRAPEPQRVEPLTPPVADTQEDHGDE